MSHFATIQTQIKDIQALKDACSEMGLLLLQNTDARGYGTNRHRGEYVIALKGPYDIAVNRQPDGAYGLTTDWWDGHVEKEVGKDYGKLLQLYGAHKATQEARRKGYTVQRQTLKDGSIKLCIGLPAGALA
jgi:Protein of unknown function (DUF1257)